MQGIKFNTQGVDAILSGLKTMTRRPAKDTDLIDTLLKNGGPKTLETFTRFSKYKVGEVVFVQEEFSVASNGAVQYRQDAYNYCPDEWHGAAEMAEEQSRNKIKITGIKVERLQDISEDDCIKEGIKICIGATSDDNLSYLGQGDFMTHQEVFKEYIWKELPYQLPYDWNSNPYVFVYEFEIV